MTLEKANRTLEIAKEFPCLDCIVKPSCSVELPNGHIYLHRPCEKFTNWKKLRDAIMDELPDDLEKARADGIILGFVRQTY